MAGAYIGLACRGSRAHRRIANSEGAPIPNILSRPEPTKREIVLKFANAAEGVPKPLRRQFKHWLRLQGQPAGQIELALAYGGNLEVGASLHRLQHVRLIAEAYGVLHTAIKYVEMPEPPIEESVLPLESVDYVLVRSTADAVADLQPAHDDPANLKGANMYKRIMIVIAEGAVGKAAVNEGLAVAKAHGAEVYFFHVLANYVLPMPDTIPMPAEAIDGYRKRVEKRAVELISDAARRAKRLGVRSTDFVSTGGDEADCIANAALKRKCDLIVVGSYGRTALQRLIYGSVVTRLITLSTKPVLVCKAQSIANVTAEENMALPLKSSKPLRSDRADAR